MLWMNRALLGESPLPLAVQALSFALMVWARLTFGARSFHAGANPTEGGLVTSGPYRFIRHPIYAAALCFIWAGVLSHFSEENFLLGSVAAAGAWLRMHAEERLLVVRYPDYSDYARRTKRIIPSLL
jgi:protein-S-isoprenylcysteine O-methyltransferase Ste14